MKENLLTPLFIKIKLCMLLQRKTDRQTHEDLDIHRHTHAHILTCVNVYIKRIQYQYLSLIDTNLNLSRRYPSPMYLVASAIFFFIDNSFS